ncbi:hypothetical protein GE09DRAFT_1108113 [Coniochaeta sp. 2T2.1]|nr:hypothetical protein GE09DRAFT_1108113 [Coniochaeta sp. 2T2.1]
MSTTHNSDSAESHSRADFEALKEPELLEPPPRSPKWTPPPEPHKPYIPYRRGCRWTIYRHTSPRPFGAYYASRDGEREEGEREEVLHDELVKTTVTDLCHAHPPAEGITHYDVEPRQIEIVEPLEVKDGHGAQIFVCRLDSDATEYVAKVYDPLYYGYANLMWSDLPRDVTYAADGDYSREVAAYEHLEKESFPCPELPSYYGSWTFDVPTDARYTDPRTGKHTRPVRMILMEHLDGKTMLDMNVARTPLEHRFSIISRAMEINSRLGHIGINHNDVSQRNIMVCGYDSPHQVPSRVCLFDFNMAVVSQLSVVEDEYASKGKSLPYSPVDVWWDMGVFEFINWFPEDWEDETREWHRWLLDTYRNSDLYEPTQKTVEETEGAVIFGADGKPYAGSENNDDYVRRRSSTPLLMDQSKGGTGLPELAHFGNDSVSRSPKRTRDDFMDDGVDFELELRDRKTTSLGPDISSGTGNGGSGVTGSARFNQPGLGHISIGVTEYGTAKMFYSGALKPLGLDLVYDSEGPGSSSIVRTLGYGPDEDTELLNIFEYKEEAQAPGRGCHIAFNAPNRKAVDEFHEQALLWGGTCDSKPGLRTRYGPNYYAAFVISPDGWKLEAVCKTPE